MGYRLLDSPALLLPEEIDLDLATEVIGTKIIHYEQIESTNGKAKEEAGKGAEEGTIILAEEQTTGKGRIGREFCSPKGGIWLSAILRPDLKAVLATRATYIVSLAIAKTIDKLTPLEPQIKWPNDILIEGKKVSGILTEMGAEIDQINYLIVGIGINANFTKAELPTELRDKATTLYHELDTEIDRVKFVQELLRFIEVIYAKIADFEAILTEWKDYAYTLGQKVLITGTKDKIEGRAVDIANDGALIIRVDGNLKRVYSGDVSLRHQD